MWATVEDGGGGLEMEVAVTEEGVVGIKMGTRNDKYFRHLLVFLFVKSTENTQKSNTSSLLRLRIPNEKNHEFTYLTASKKSLALSSGKQTCEMPSRILSKSC